MKNSNSTTLKVLGVIMIIFAIVYAAVGTLTLMGTLSNVLPGHEKEEVIVVALAYGVALLSLICGIVCVKGAAKQAKVFGALFALLGLVSLVYVQITQSSLMYSISWHCFSEYLYFLRLRKSTITNLTASCISHNKGIACLTACPSYYIKKLQLRNLS